MTAGPGVHLSALLFAFAAPAAAQVAPNRAATYLPPTDVTDARALWVNPAGLARLQEASVGLDVTVGDPGPSGRVRQLTLGFNSRGFAFGYQRDLFDGAPRGHTYRAGLAAGHQGLSAGVAVVLYRGGSGGTAWDLGMTYVATPTLTVGGAVANIGQPTVRGARQEIAYVPGATWQPLGPGAAVSVQGRFSPDTTGEGYAFGARWQGGGRSPVGLLARLDTDRHLRRVAFAFGLSIGASDLLGTVVTTPGNVSKVDAVSVYGVSTRTITR